MAAYLVVEHVITDAAKFEASFSSSLRRAICTSRVMLTLQSEYPIATTNMMMERQPITEPLCAAEWRYGA